MNSSFDQLISVIIPTYNRAHFLPDAIESIQKQDYPNLEIIVVDDGSTDNTKKVVQNISRNIKYIYQENRGPAAAKNTGLKAAEGEIIGFLDSDDLWPEKKINMQLNVLIESDLEMLFGGVKHLMLEDSKNNTFFEHSESHNRNSLGSALFKRYIFEKVGLFNEDLIHWEDLDWILRAKENGVNILKLKEITLIVRIHENNISRDIESGKKFLSKVLKTSIQRRRGGNCGPVKKLNLLDWLKDDD